MRWPWRRPASAAVTARGAAIADAGMIDAGLALRVERLERLMASMANPGQDFAAASGPALLVDQLERDLLPAHPTPAAPPPARHPNHCQHGWHYDECPDCRH